MEAFRQLTYKELNLFAGMMSFIHRYARFLAMQLHPDLLSGRWEQEIKRFLKEPYLKNWEQDSLRRPDYLDRINLIDFQNAPFFTTQLEPKLIQNYGNNVKNWTNTIHGLKMTRNYLVHNNTDPLTDEELSAAWSQMMNIAKIINDQELVDELTKLKDGKVADDERNGFLMEFEKERQDYIEQERKKRKSYKRLIYLLCTTLLILVAYILIYQIKSGNRQLLNLSGPVLNRQDTITQIDKKRSDVPKGKTTLVVNRPIPVGKPVTVEDFSTYVNAASVIATGKADVSVMILGEDGNISPSLTSSIVDIYSKSGKKVNMGLLKNTFTLNPEFQNLVAGNSDIIDKLKLANYTSYLVVGKVNYLFSSGSLANGTVVCNASLSINIISTITKSIYKSFNILPTNGNDVTQSAAKERALQKLLTIFQDQYSTI